MWDTDTPILDQGFGDISPGFQSQGGPRASQINSGATPADLLVASMVAESLFDAYTCMHMYKHCWGWYPGLSMLLPHSVWQTRYRMNHAGLPKRRRRVNLNLLHVCYQMYAGVTLTKTELKVIEARSGKGRDILFFVVKKKHYSKQRMEDSLITLGRHPIWLRDHPDWPPKFNLKDPF